MDGFFLKEPRQQQLIHELWEQLKELSGQWQGALCLCHPVFAVTEDWCPFDLAMILHNAPPLEQLGKIYRIPEDGPAPEAVVEVVGNATELGEAVSRKADFCQAIGVHDYLIVEQFPGQPLRLWYAKPVTRERPKFANEAVLTSLKLIIRPEGANLRMFSLEGKEFLPPKVLLEQERSRREALEQLVAELSQRVAELGRLLQG